MTILIQEYVFRLEVSVYDSFPMQTSKSLDHLCRVYFCSILIESLFFSQICKHLSSIEEVDNEVQLGLCLECIVKSDNIWILDLLKNVSFS